MALPPRLTESALNATYVRGGGELGPQLVTNGDFATDLTGWSGGGWTWEAGAARSAAGANPLTQATLVPTVGATYEVTFTASTGGVRVYLGGGYVMRGGDTVYITAGSTDPLQIIPEPTFAGTVDNVSVRQVISDSTRIDAKTTFSKALALHGGIEIPNGTPIAIGFEALPKSTRGQFNIPSSNIGIGYRAGYRTTEGHVTAVGYRAGEANDIGVLTAFGKWAGMSNTSGHSTMFGNAAGMSNTTGHIDVFGDEAGADNVSGTIAVFGYYAGHQNVSGILTAFGHEAAMFTGPSPNATVVGHQAGQRATGTGLTAVGFQAGQTATTGRTTAVGHETARNVADASVTAVGYRAAVNKTSGRGTFVGDQAGYGVTTGRVTAVGDASALEVTTGNVVAIGHQAGYGVTTANAPKTDTEATFIGDHTGRAVPSSTQLDNYVAIGSRAVVSKSNQVVIGNTSIQETVLRGTVDMDTKAGALLVPRLTTTEKGAIPSVRDGMVVYDTTLGKFQGRQAGAWVDLA